MSPATFTTTIDQLICSNCHEPFDIRQVQHFSTCCNKPLLAIANNLPLNKDILKDSTSMWRYEKLLPLFDQRNRISLGEGMTPILRLNRVGGRMGFGDLWLKDEGQNPTGSFKARGISMAVSKAKELGVQSCIIPTAGNAGGALAAYCAAANMKAIVVMPRHTPKAFQDECRFYGTELHLVDGLIDECGKVAARLAKTTEAFNMSTLKEPYRLEGKKTMGFEIAEQLNWELPEVIIYPTGGGTGLIGIWKAFQEMISLGWISPDHLPRMIVVQSERCAPMVDFVNKHSSHAPYGESMANGLAVPQAFGQDLIKRVVQESKGSALAVKEADLLSSALELSRLEGLSISPEGGATLAGLKQLVDKGLVSREEKILLLNTGSAHKYLDNFEI